MRLLVKTFDALLMLLAGIAASQTRLGQQAFSAEHFPWAAFGNNHAHDGFRPRFAAMSTTASVASRALPPPCWRGRPRQPWRKQLGRIAPGWGWSRW